MQAHWNISDRDEKIIPCENALTCTFAYKSLFTLSQTLCINKPVWVQELADYGIVSIKCSFRLEQQEEVDTYCWSSPEEHTCRWGAPVLAWPLWDKPYLRCSSAQPPPPHDARPVARCCSPECYDCSRIRQRRGEEIPVLTPEHLVSSLHGDNSRHHSSHHTSQHNNES